MFIMKKNFTYIDLFCGIGGFHQAMSSLGGKCVFASEIDEHCIQVYENNYHINSNFDITKVDAKDIPNHDVLCAGFPCQSFSKAGKQLGTKDTRGTLFFEIERILRAKHTKYIILENVRNLVSHDGGRTWKIIQSVLKDIGYRLTSKPIILSPYQFGIPQTRERVYILGVYDPKNIDTPLDISFKNLLTKKDNSIYSILDRNVDDRYNISIEESQTLNVWDEFYQGIKEDVIGFPVWVDYFKVGPSENFPVWKNEIIKCNNQLYLNNRKFIDRWLTRNHFLNYLNPSRRKFEWQAGTSINSLWEGVIQLRPSGIRVKKPDVFPALVAIVQIPIIGKYRRKLTPRECARLQSFPDDFIVCEDDHYAYKEFGNSVNVKVLIELAKKLFKYK